MDRSPQQAALDAGNSTYYGRTKKDHLDSKSHLDHLFDHNNNNTSYSYDSHISPQIENNTNSPSMYNYNQNNGTPPLNNSYNNSPMSTSTKSSFSIRSTHPTSSNNYNEYNSLNSAKTRNSTLLTNNTLNNNHNDNNDNSNNYLDECHNNLIRKMNKLQNFKKGLINQQDSAIKDADIAKTKISDAAQQLHRIIEEDKEKLLKETVQYAESTRHELEKIRLDVEQNLKASEELLKVVEDLKASCPPEEVASHVESIGAMAKQLDRINQDVTVGALRFKACEVAKGNLLGKVSVSDLDTSDPYMDEPVRVGLIEGSQAIAGITASHGKIYIIRELLPNVEIYNSNLSRHKMLKLEGLRKPSDIAADSLSTHVYISDASGCIFKLNPESNVLNKLAIDVSGDPQGLYVVPSDAENAGNILITCSDSKQVKEFTNQGDFVRCIKLQHDVANPWHCVSVEEGGWGGKALGERRFVISHGYESGKPHRICYISAKGLTLASFGKSNGSGNMKIDIPNRIALDKFGYVFVADRNNDRVVLLSPNLVYVRDVINKFQKIKQPKRLFLDQENGWLFVGLINGSVHIFQLCESVLDDSGHNISLEGHDDDSAERN